MSTREFWDNVFRNDQEITSLSEDLYLAVREAVSYFGSLSGKRLIDIGCGSGATSLYFASLGASVTSIDQSSIAIAALKNYCRANHIHNVEAIVGDVESMEASLPADFVFGSMILHHIEPLEPFAARLRRLLSASGRGFFWENNGSSEILMWFRTHIVGRYGISKYSDDEESPLTDCELEVFRKYFLVERTFPYVSFFRLAPSYLFRGRLMSMCRLADEVVYAIPDLRKYSYRQYIYLR